jgi:hypothetical protein
MVGTGGFMRTTKTVTVTSEIPSDITNEQVTGFFRNHAKVISSSPFVQEVKLIEPPESLHGSQQEADELFRSTILAQARWITFQVKEKVPYYGQIEFLASQKDADTGSVAVFHAPQNLQMLLQSGAKTETAGTRLVEETCIFHGNALLMPFVLRSFKKAHLGMHQRMFKELRTEANPADPSTAMT